MFPLGEHRPVAFDGALPREADVVVIGAGIIGVCTALFLAEQGRRVLLLEKGRVAAEQSARNWGWIRQQGRDAAELPIMIEALGIWKDLAAQCDVDIGLRPGGVGFYTQSEKELASFRDWLPIAQTHHVDTRLRSTQDIQARHEGMRKTYRGGMETATDMRAEPWLAVPAMARLAVHKGVEIRENCAVRCLDLDQGVLRGVVSEKGRITTPQVVLAAGAWSSLFLRNHGIWFPQLSVRETVGATAALPNVYDGAGVESKVAFRRRLDGGYTLAPAFGAAELFIGPDAFRALPRYLPLLKRDPFGQGYRLCAPRGFPDAWGTRRRWKSTDVTPFEQMRVLNPAPNLRKAMRLAPDFSAVFSGLPEVKLTQSWAGMIDLMPDLVPVVDHCPGIKGLTLGFGMCGHGFGIGPAMGRILAALVTGQSLGHDLRRFRASRFSDSSPIWLGPGPNPAEDLGEIDAH